MLCRKEVAEEEYSHLNLLAVVAYFAHLAVEYTFPVADIDRLLKVLAVVRIAAVEDIAVDRIVLLAEVDMFVPRSFLWAVVAYIVLLVAVEDIVLVVVGIVVCRSSLLVVDSFHLYSLVVVVDIEDIHLAAVDHIVRFLVGHLLDKVLIYTVHPAVEDNFHLYNLVVA